MVKFFVLNTYQERIMDIVDYMYYDNVNCKIFDMVFGDYCVCAQMMIAVDIPCELRTKYIGMFEDILEAIKK